MITYCFIAAVAAGIVVGYMLVVHQFLKNAE